MSQNNKEMPIRIGGRGYDFNRLSSIKILLRNGNIRLGILPHILSNYSDIIDLTPQEAEETFRTIGLCGVQRLRGKTLGESANQGTIFKGDNWSGLGPRISFGCKMGDQLRIEGCYLDMFQSFTPPKAGVRFQSGFGSGGASYYPADVASFRYEGAKVMIVVDPVVMKLLSALDNTVGAHRTRIIQQSGLRNIGYHDTCVQLSPEQFAFQF